MISTQYLGDRLNALDLQLSAAIQTASKGPSLYGEVRIGFQLKQTIANMKCVYAQYLTTLEVQSANELSCQLDPLCAIVEKFINSNWPELQCLDFRIPDKKKFQHRQKELCVMAMEIQAIADGYLFDPNCPRVTSISPAFVLRQQPNSTPVRVQFFGHFDGALLD